MHYDAIIVGAGFAGAVVAEQLASSYNKKVLIIEKRNHIGGNAYDEYDKNGVLIHRYGPHIFHTNSEKVYKYLSQFTEWRIYQHRVLALVDGKEVPIPINLDTINILYGTRYDSTTIELFYETNREVKEKVNNSEDLIVSKIGQDLYKKIFKGYTTKQWGIGPEELDSSICSRLPVRTNRDDRYFSDKYQLMPKYGYTRMFERMLKHPNIQLLLQTDYKAFQKTVSYDRLFYTGAIDQYFGYKHGHLKYRSLEFEYEYIDCESAQSVATINFPNEYNFTRCTEMKKLTGQIHLGTTIVREYPKSEGDPYYPVPMEETKRIYAMYQKEAEKLEKVIFLGRLGTYKYYNMDQVVAQALHTVKKVMNK
ncbi:UDP-galactopyranose mutase [Bacillus sp. A116_S68]|nr:UDP-galactopyranose mutase [Bacillus sp. A116_S68]